MQTYHNSTAELSESGIDTAVISVGSNAHQACEPKGIGP